MNKKQCMNLIRQAEIYGHTIIAIFYLTSICSCCDAGDTWRSPVCYIILQLHLFLVDGQVWRKHA